MRMLFIDQSTKQKIEALKKFAEANVVTVNEMRAIVAGTMMPKGNFPGFSMIIPDGFRVVFTIEQHPQLDGSFVTMKHISISVASLSGTTFANPAAVDEIISHFGFKTVIMKNEYHNARIWKEKDQPAINIAEAHIVAVPRYNVFDGDSAHV